MKLNHDNVRQLLLYLENNKSDSSASESDLLEFAKKYSIEKNELIYIIQKLTEADFIKSNIKYASDTIYWFSISTITWEGHKYLDNVRDPQVWKESKKIAGKISSVSIDIMSTIAINVISKILFPS